MPSIKEKLQKFFRLEADLGYNNRAVFGGLERLADSWPAEAREAGISEELIPAVAKLLREYPNLTKQARRDALVRIGELVKLPNPGSLLPAPNDLEQTPELIEEPKTPSEKEFRKAQDLPPLGKPKATSGASSNGKKTESRSKVNQRLKAAARQTASPETAGLEAPVSVIRGIGEKQGRNLARLGVNTIRDLLYLFPRRYDDYSRLKTISQLKSGEEVTVVARVVDFTKYPTKRGRSIVEAIVSDTTGALRLLWFNQDYQLRYLRQGLFLSISGKVETYMGRPVIYHPDYEAVDQQQLNTNRIVPVYPLTALVTQRWLRRTMFNTVQYWADRVPDFLPEAVAEKADVIHLMEALRQIHFPDSAEALSAAQKRFAFDEIFLLQLGVLRQKRQWQQLEGTPYPVTDEWLAERIKSLPYALTKAQKTALNNIRQDVSSPHPMNRLLQGDVGSGKTVVAVIGMAMVIQAGAQAALMAPTGILADQHFRTVQRLLCESGNGIPAMLEEGQVRLLTGDSSASERQEILQGLASGYIKLLVGTHALIEEPVTFQRLQMVVVDEQHRFGVAQRASLRSKGENPHLLVMTATPIPRSLQLTIFGDLDVSIMDEMPAGRRPIETSIALPYERERVYARIREQVSKGYQAFIIYPLVEQGENEENKAAVEESERLQKDIFPDLRVGLVHGRLKPAEKDAVMLSFRNKEFDILVSTSVVEVGVDIPNATMMVIEGANRFGLAQLHQFRGRVGRGEAQSYCILIPETDDAAENERLKVMTETNDGFILAEKDLSQRGPGDFLGTRQAGFVDLKMASLADIRTIQKARVIAEEVLKQDPGLNSGENLALRQAVDTFWPAQNGNGDMS